MSEQLSGKERQQTPETDQESIEQAQKAIEKKHESLEIGRHDKDSQAERERSSAEALEHAAEVEKQRAEQERAQQELSPKTERLHTKQERQEQYNAIMSETRSHMRPTSRAFSKVIHNRAVEATSEALGKTVARPNAILSGSMSAFIITLVVYIVARYFGYPLSGSETMLAFAAGWLIGILFDYLRTMITGKHDI